jgi:opacity protein-like surface antigen
MRYTFSTQFAVMTALSIGMGSACATAYSQNQAQNPKKNMEQEDCAFGHRRGISPSRSCNFWISGDFLYWSTCMDGFSCEYGDTTINTTIVNSVPTTSITEENEDIDFEWGPGFRIGLGGDWPCSGWDVGVFWTRFFGEGQAHHEHNRADWRLHFDTLDAVLGRKFWVGKRVDLRPFVGLRYAQIKQKLHTHLRTNIIAATGNSTVTSTIKDRQGMWAFGPELGLEADFYFGRGWSIYGNLDGAILYGHTKTRFDNTDTFALADNICNSTSASCSNQKVLDVGIGIRWEIKYFTFQGGLEQHTYFDYNGIGCCGDLNLFGCNLSAAVHF